MTALARAIAEDCDAPPVLVLLPPFESQRVADHLAVGGFLPLIISSPSFAWDLIAAFQGDVAGVVVGDPDGAFEAEGFCFAVASTYPRIPLLLVHFEPAPANPSSLVRLYPPLTCEAVLRSLLHGIANVRRCQSPLQPP